ncbi:MAG: hypothetical protein LAT55_13070 [Opitutales bacterium]|nr:hypothetical protein [Opitutales bacterium]
MSYEDAKAKELEAILFYETLYSSVNVYLRLPDIHFDNTRLGRSEFNRVVLQTEWNEKEETRWDLYTMFYHKIDGHYPFEKQLFALDRTFAAIDPENPGDHALMEGSILMERYDTRTALDVALAAVLLPDDADLAVRLLHLYVVSLFYGDVEMAQSIVEGDVTFSLEKIDMPEIREHVKAFIPKATFDLRDYMVGMKNRSPEDYRKLIEMVHLIRDIDESTEFTRYKSTQVYDKLEHLDEELVYRLLKTLYSTKYWRSRMVVDVIVYHLDLITSDPKFIPFFAENRNFRRLYRIINNEYRARYAFKILERILIDESGEVSAFFEALDLSESCYVASIMYISGRRPWRWVLSEEVFRKNYAALSAIYEATWNKFLAQGEQEEDGMVNPITTWTFFKISNQFARESIRRDVGLEENGLIHRLLLYTLQYPLYHQNDPRYKWVSQLEAGDLLIKFYEKTNKQDRIPNLEKFINTLRQKQ